MSQWLYNRLKSESPEIEPRFALQSTINWVAALSVICGEGQFEDSSLANFYSGVPRRAANVTGDNATFECALMALHQYSSLIKINERPDDHYDLVRAAIISWYYGVYNAASAMVAAADGTTQETHTSTANAWNRQLNVRGLILAPFNYHLTSLIKAEYEQQITTLRAGNTFDLNRNPSNYDMAFGACLSYLKGTANREREILEECMKSDKEFKALGVSDFRTKVARQYRDRKLQGKGTAFLHEAFRFRGKANYRDAIYLSYGREDTAGISALIEGLLHSLRCFLRMASHYASRRVERGMWQTFLEDLDTNSSLSVPNDVLRV